MSQNNWELFFNNHAPHYMENGFTKNTIYEVQFLLEQFKLQPGSSILDMGCGTGRHSVELAKHGFHVTGVDISEGMLKQAKLAAEAASVEVEFIQCDATTFRAVKQYDAAVCLCEGAFGLIGNNEHDPVEHDLAILQNISDALKPKGQFILTTLNAYELLRRLKQEDIDSGRFNPETMVERYIDTWDLPEGKKEVTVYERRFFPSELKYMFAQVGLKVDYVWSGALGHWAERKPISFDDIEIMLVARKLD